MSSNGQAPPERRPAWGEILGVLAVIGAGAVGAVSLRDPAAPAAPPGTCEEILKRYAEARLRQADPRPAPSTAARIPRSSCDWW